MKKIVSLSTDFGPGNKGIGVMKAVILGICPEAEIIDLAHDNEGFDIRQGARNFEAVAWLPVGAHVCVVDPGVGTKRKGIAVETARGDFLVGPDNGVLLPATRLLGGIKRAHALSNDKFFRKPVSPVFHGRDVFAPVAAHLANGTAIEEFGPGIKEKELAEPAYLEAKAEGDKITAQVTHINMFGSLFVNIMQEEMHKLFQLNDRISMIAGKKKIALQYKQTFGEVPFGKEVIMDDDFGRVEIALNQASFAKKYPIKQGQEIILRKVKT